MSSSSDDDNDAPPRRRRLLPHALPEGRGKLEELALIYCLPNFVQGLKPYVQSQCSRAVLRD